MANFEIIQIKSEEIDSYRGIIVGLWKDNLSNGSDERFDWLYKKNPAGSAVTWLAKDEKSGEYIGCATLCPRALRINGKFYKMGIVIDVAINENYRVFGPVLKIQKAITQNGKAAGFDFLFAWPSSAAEGVFKRAGYTVLSEVSGWVKLLNVENKIDIILKPKFLMYVIGVFLNTILRVRDFFYLVKKTLNWEWVILRSCDYRFDVLANQIDKGARLEPVMTADFLNWRYAQCPFKEYLFFCAGNKIENNIKGFIVYSNENTSVLIWDIVCLDNFRMCLLSDFVRVMRKEGIRTIRFAYLGEKNVESEFKRIGFLKRNACRPGFIFLNRDLLLDEKEKIMFTNNWFLFDGELDL